MWNIFKRALIILHYQFKFIHILYTFSIFMNWVSEILIVVLHFFLLWLFGNRLCCSKIINEKKVSKMPNMRVFQHKNSHPFGVICAHHDTSIYCCYFRIFLVSKEDEERNLRETEEILTKKRTQIHSCERNKQAKTNQENTNICMCMCMCTLYIGYVLIHSIITKQSL